MQIRLSIAVAGLAVAAAVSVAATSCAMRAGASASSGARDTSGAGQPATSALQAVGSVHEALQLDSDFARVATLYALALRMDQRGIERLLDELSTVVEGRERRMAAGILYSRLAELDPEAAVERIMRATEFDAGALALVFRLWSQDHLQEALERAGSLSEPSRSLAIRSILLARDELSRAEREALASKYQVRVDLRRDPDGALDLRTAQSSERAWRAALDVADSDERNARLLRVAAAWGRQAPEAALLAIGKIEVAKLRQQLAYQVVEAWAEREPGAALEWVLARDVSTSRAPLLRVVMARLASEQPRAAFELFDKLVSGEQRSVLPVVIERATSKDPQPLMDWMATIEDRSWRREILTVVARHYDLQDAETALRWASALPPDDGELLVPELVSRIGAQEPARAAAVITSIGNPQHRAYATYGLAKAWAETDPAAALAWLTQQPVNESSQNAAQQIFYRWAAADPAGLFQQLTQIDDAALRDEAAVRLINSEYVELTMAEQAYSRIQGANARKQAAVQVYFRLNAIDRARAARFRKESGIEDVPLGE